MNSLDPAAARRARAADFVFGRNTLDGAGRRGVEIEILLLRAGPEAVEVRLVPDLEIPRLHFVVAVAFLHVER